MHITFGRDPNQVYHTFRWVLTAGLDVNTVIAAIEEDLLRTLSSQVVGLHKGEVNAAGCLIRYHAYRFQDRSFNVGRITVERYTDQPSAPA